MKWDACSGGVIVGANSLSNIIQYNACLRIYVCNKSYEHNHVYFRIIGAFNFYFERERFQGF